MRQAKPSKAQLSGLRQVVPKAFNSSFNVYHDPMIDFDQKPLPPTPRPRPASSIYSIQKEDIIDAYGDEVPIEQLWTSQKLLLPSSYTGDNGNIARLSFTASKLTRGQLKHSSSDAVYIIGHVDSIASNKRRSVLDRGRPPRKKASVPLLGIPQSPNTPSSGAGAAAEQARNYQDVLTPRPLTPIAPLVAATIDCRYDDSYPIVPLSPRIIDVIGCDLPDILSTMSVSNTSEKRSLLSRNVSRIRNPSSIRNTSNTSRVSNSRNASNSRNPSASRNASGTRNTSKSPVRQATPPQALFNPAVQRVTNRSHVRAASDDEIARLRAKATPSPMSKPKLTAGPPPRQEKTQSLTVKRRTSLQNSINTVFPGTVAINANEPPLYNSYLKSSFFKPTSTTSHHTPAIPITPYQALGIKAWDPPPKPKKSRPNTTTNTNSYLPSLRRRNSATKRRSRWSWHGIFHFGEEREKARRREELKKKIVVVGPADPFVLGRYYPWV